MEKFVVNIKDLDVFASLECGQTFRFKKLNNDLYEVYSLNKYALIEKQGDSFVISTNDVDYFYKYFALDENYDEILNQLKSNPKINKLLPSSECRLRILKQNPIEMIFSFIISANNNIPRIKGIIDRISAKYGHKIEFRGKEFYTFPTVEELSKASKQDFRDLGAGFRDKYIYETTLMINNKIVSLEELQSEKNTKKVREKLLTLCGVGPKVADCILLFSSLKRFDVFPIDVWVRRVMNDLYIHNEDEKKVSKAQIEEIAIEKFGELEGIAQQYLFYWKRENNIWVWG